MISVGIVDDHKIVVEGLENLVNESKLARVSGKSYSAAECRSMLRSGQPDVLLLDISLPDGNGIELCAEIKERYPQIKVLMLTSYSERTIINRALENGASGYVLKNSDPQEILEGILTVAEGNRFLCSEVDVLLRKYVSCPIELTRRERELLQLLIAGYTSNEIADKMCLGYETIRSYRKNLLMKLDVHNTAMLIKKAIDERLV
ncbi:MAG: response regulator transcription factor [Prevotella sp.]|jgi:DNA-binding NarL/FixJ family response regulator|nr:response regulator transcription factor [Prevotella sp.]